MTNCKITEKEENRWRIREQNKSAILQLTYSSSVHNTFIRRTGYVASRRSGGQCIYINIAKSKVIAKKCLRTFINMREHPFWWNLRQKKNALQYICNNKISGFVAKQKKKFLFSIFSDYCQKGALNKNKDNNIEVFLWATIKNKWKT